MICDAELKPLNSLQPHIYIYHIQGWFRAGSELKENQLSLPRWRILTHQVFISRLLFLVNLCCLQEKRPMNESKWSARMCGWDILGLFAHVDSSSDLNSRKAVSSASRMGEKWGTGTPILIKGPRASPQNGCHEKQTKKKVTVLHAGECYHQKKY